MEGNWGAVEWVGGQKGDRGALRGTRGKQVGCGGQEEGVEGIGGHHSGGRDRKGLEEQSGIGGIGKSWGVVGGQV